jgi:glycosyltransferase involved in cell wall biosynthesis
VRIAHVITDLDTGGAQIMLKRLVARLQTEGVGNAVISLGRPSSAFDELGGLGVPIHHLNAAPSRIPGPRTFLHLGRLLRGLRPDIVHTWLYHADLVGGLAARLTGIAPVVWGIHHTTGPSEPLKPATRAVVRLNRLLSWFVPDRIICCAHASRESHAALGYSRRKMVVIANGLDTDQFRPDSNARAGVRRELGLPPHALIVASMARFHPQKDHETFVRAAGDLCRRLPAVHFVLAGRGVDRENRALAGWIDATGAPDRFHLLGKRDDMPRLTAACDVVSTSSAFGEASPLVLAEGMACGVPCVATDVGDSGAMVGDTGRVVPPRDPHALAGAWESILRLAPDERVELGTRARARVVAEFELGVAVRKHLSLYREVSEAARA